MALMRTCGKCGWQRRRWPRRCPRCRSGAADRAETATDAGELAADLGVFGWIARGFAAVTRLVLRLLN